MSTRPPAASPHPRRPPWSRPSPAARPEALAAIGAIHSRRCAAWTPPRWSASVRRRPCGRSSGCAADRPAPSSGHGTAWADPGGTRSTASPRSLRAGSSPTSTRPAAMKASRSRAAIRTAAQLDVGDAALEHQPAHEPGSCPDARRPARQIAACPTQVASLACGGSCSGSLWWSAPPGRSAGVRVAERRPKAPTIAHPRSYPLAT